MATKTIAWTTGSGKITLTYTGQGNDSISVSSSENDSFSDRSQSITIVTTAGSPEKNISVLIKQQGKKYDVGEVFNFDYTGNVQQVVLPKGRYKLQCWGAQGGSNEAYSSYGISAKTGGKGGYSEGVLTLSQVTTLYIFVGGKGASSGNGGWNGGGGGTGTSTYSYSGNFGYTKAGGGGGSTDIAMETSSMSYSSYRTNRSSASLLSRIIVAGGGSGGAMTYRSTTTTSTSSTTVSDSAFVDGTWVGEDGSVTSNSYRASTGYYSVDSSCTITVSNSPSGTPPYFYAVYFNSSKSYLSTVRYGTNWGGSSWNTSVPSGAAYVRFVRYYAAYYTSNTSIPKTTPTINRSTSSTSSSTDSQVGFAGGGTSGIGNRPGTQSSSGSLAGFGYGANQPATNACHISGCGGGGWYGGGAAEADATISQVRQSGGGSGFVNISSNASYRPSGYTGLQLDSGTTKAGNTSFESTSGGTETGHSGNGYARITVLE